jgi:hypothetical protein
MRQFRALRPLPTFTRLTISSARPARPDGEAAPDDGLKGADRVVTQFGLVGFAYPLAYLGRSAVKPRASASSFDLHRRADNRLHRPLQHPRCRPFK